MRSEWIEYKLGEVTRFQQGKQVELEDQFPVCEDGQIRFVRIIDHTNESEPPRYIKASTEWSSYVTEDDVIMIRYGSQTAGKVVIGKAGVIANNMFRVIPTIENIHRKYLYYFLKTPKVHSYLRGGQSSSTMPAITFGLMSSIDIQVPSLPTQNKIAHILSALDDKIELNRKMNQTLEAMAQALFKSWFVDFDPVHLKARCQSEEELKAGAKELGISREILELFPSAFVESEMGMIPEGWEVKTLNDVVDFQNGYSFKSKELHDDPTNSIKVFKMGHIHRGGGFKEEGKDTYFTVLEQKKMYKYLLKKGDLLMAMTDMKANMALLAHTALMPHDDKYLLNQRVGRLRVKKDLQVGYPYLYIFSNYSDTINDLRSRSNSGVQVNLTTKAILETKILLSSDALLMAFNSLAQIMFEKIFANDAEIVSLQKTRDTLLPKLLSGELDVSEIEYSQEHLSDMDVGDILSKETT